MKIPQYSFLALLLLLALIPGLTFAQSNWLSNRITNTSIFLDPTEIQMSGSINGLTDYNTTENQYLPFGVGGSQSIVSKRISEDKAWEFFGEMGVFTQFSWTQVDGEQQRNMLNVDYKIAFSYARTSGPSTWRLRFFHVSSHLGDDYIIRNQIRKYSENKVNYEQLEFTYFRELSTKSRIYGGVGSVVRPNSLRLPFSYHFGLHTNLRKEAKKWCWTMGAYTKGMQETDFTPSVKLGIGRAYFTESKAEPVRLLVEYYKGQLPYSQLESNRIEWIGLGLYFYL